MTIRELTAADFDSTIAANKYVLVEFYSQTCVPCKMLLPALEQLAEEYDGEVMFARVDAMNPENSLLAERYHIDRVPVTVLLHNYNIVDYVGGMWSKDTMQDTIDRMLDGE